MASVKGLTIFSLDEGKAKIDPKKDWYMVRDLKREDGSRTHQLFMSKGVFQKAMKLAKADAPKDFDQAFVIILSNLGRELEL